MSIGNFKVQVIARDTGKDHWVTVQAHSREDAIARVASLGEIVGEARLDSVAAQSLPPDSIPGAMSRESPEPLPSEAGAIACAWLGLLLGPLAVVGLVWGANLKSKTGGRRGNHAFVVGIIMTVLWGFWLLIQLGSE
jgi:hypothetical protein